MSNNRKTTVDDSHEYQTKMQRSDNSLLRTVDNFINYCENGSDFSRHRDRLNTILNDLNSIEFQHGQARDIVEVRERPSVDIYTK